MERGATRTKRGAPHLKRGETFFAEKRPFQSKVATFDARERCFGIFRRETTGLDVQAQNPARLTGDEHEGFWFHGFLTQRRKGAEKLLFGFLIFFVFRWRITADRKNSFAHCRRNYFQQSRFPRCHETGKIISAQTLWRN